MGKPKSNKGKGKATASAEPVAVEEVEEIEVEQAPERGGHVPPMVKDVPEGPVQKAKGLVETWQLYGSQVVWRMTCLLDMENKKSLMKPLSQEHIVYMGQVVSRRAASLRLRALFLVEWCGHLRPCCML